MFNRSAVLACTAFLVAVAPSSARAPGPADPRVPDTTSALALAGPRFGFTVLTDQMRQKLNRNNIAVGSYITQFGWQFEKQFLANPGGLTAVSEWVLLFGGLDQGAFLPSLSWILGLRGSGGSEFGIGPNISAAGAALVIAGGVTIRNGALNIPVNLAIVPSQEGMRVSVLTGWTLR